MRTNGVQHLANAEVQKGTVNRRRQALCARPCAWAWRTAGCHRFDHTAAKAPSNGTQTELERKKREQPLAPAWGQIPKSSNESSSGLPSEEIPKSSNGVSVQTPPAAKERDQPANVVPHAQRFRSHPTEPSTVQPDENPKSSNGVIVRSTSRRDSEVVRRSHRSDISSCVRNQPVNGVPPPQRSRSHPTKSSTGQLCEEIPKSFNEAIVRSTFRRFPESSNGVIIQATFRRDAS